MKRLLLTVALLLAVAALLRLPCACAEDAPPAKPAPAMSDEPAKPAEPSKPAEPPPKPEAPTVAAPPGPPGMVYVDTRAGELKIGTLPKDFLTLTKARPEAMVQLRYETPQHAVALKPFFIGAFEVTNAQYLVFVDQTAKTAYKTGSSAISNLQEVGAFFVFGDAASIDGQKDSVTWGQLYEANKDALHAAKPELLKDKDGKDLEPKEVKRAFRLASLPADLELTVYRRRLPEDWFMTSYRLEDPAGADLPVRDVSYLDALAFCKWAGFHIPTEPEWEVAARGPQLRNFPWGDDWTEGMDAANNRIVEKRCNWLDAKNVNRLFDPTAIPVETLPEGKSWCGCFHMLGNVAEWTSSWFDKYPGFIKPPVSDKDKKKDKDKPPADPYESYYGDFVKVIRGGSVADRELIVLRLAARNFIGAGRHAPPRPENHFKYVGFRCASYFFEPGLDRFEAAVLPLLQGKKLRREAIADDRFAGAMAVHWVPAGSVVENHVYVTGTSHAILFAPVATLYPESDRPPARTPADVADKARGEEPLILGFFATDIAIKSQILDPKAPPPPPAAPGVRRGEKSKPLDGPRVIDGFVPAGSYVLGLHHHQIGLFKGNLDLVGYIGTPTGKQPKLSSKDKPPLSSMAVESDVDLVKCSFWIPLGGKGTEPTDGIEYSFSFVTESGALEKAGSWRESRAPVAPPAPPPAPAGSAGKQKSSGKPK